MSTARPALRVLSARETKAVGLAGRGFDTRAITLRTGLSPAEIDNAVALAVEWDIVAGDYSRLPAQPRPAPRPEQPTSTRRRARITALPLAHTAPAAVLPEPEPPKPAPPTVPPAAPAPRRRRAPVPKPAQTPPARDDGPGSQAWAELAASRTVRRWAIADGWQVPAPGKPLPGAIVLAYQKAHPATSTEGGR